MKTFDRVLGDRIKAEMYMADMTQCQLAEILGMPKKTLWTWLAGQRRITAENFYYISKVVGFSMDEITKGIAKEMEE